MFIILPLENNRLQYFVILFFRNLNIAKYNDKINNKKLLAIIQYFENWKSELKVLEY